MENLLISACLLGEPCKYDGKDNLTEGIEGLRSRYRLLPLCPEVEGGLSVPRPPAERKEGAVITSEGKDVTAHFQRGAQRALSIAREFHCTKAVLKKRSPSCGYGEIYDGSFSHRVVSGNGMTGELLSRHGIAIYNEDNFLELL